MEKDLQHTEDSTALSSIDGLAASLQQMLNDLSQQEGSAQSRGALNDALAGLNQVRQLSALGLGGASLQQMIQSKITAGYAALSEAGNALARQKDQQATLDSLLSENSLAAEAQRLSEEAARHDARLREVAARLGLDVSYLEEYDRQLAEETDPAKRAEIEIRKSQAALETIHGAQEMATGDTRAELDELEEDREALIEAQYDHYERVLTRAFMDQGLDADQARHYAQEQREQLEQESPNHSDIGQVKKQVEANLQSMGISGGEEAGAAGAVDVSSSAMTGNAKPREQELPDH